MEVVIASGKGGVGKSMLASSLLLLFSKELRVVGCDCDVDAPNLGIWLGIREYDESERILTSEKAFIEEKLCTTCGKCMSACRFGAISKEGDKFKINPFLCEGCGVCKLVCPSNAIRVREVKGAEIKVNKSKYNFPVIIGQLDPGESNSGKVVEELRKRLKSFDYDLAILDAPAGIGCPVIASIRGSNFSILVTEPTPTGLADLERILKVVEYFKLPYGIVINKWDVDPKRSKEIEAKFSSRILGKIPFDEEVVKSLINMKPVITSESEASREIRNIFKRLKEVLNL
ncbi:hypothetical protein DRN63_03010 [Nanoarchaeota archaeon]|nr:MAG: hypothetical protein DRN63_03010 [Nanoarchaeota archaeon]